MAFTAPQDLALQITVPADSPSAPPLVSSERRITPTWTIAQLKVKLEPITGIPSTTQTLRTRNIDGTYISLSDDNSLVGDARYGLRKGAEIEVQDTRPAHLRSQTTNFADPSVEKYTMPESTYSTLPNTVLTWKKQQKLGRFDPNAATPASLTAERRVHDTSLVESRGIVVGKRCRVGADDGRRGVVRFVGEIPGLGGEREAGCVWVGVQLDEPVGRNNGSVKVEVVVKRGGEDGQTGEAVEVEKRTETRRIFACPDKYGVFARPEKMEVGEQWDVLDDLGIDKDMEEI